MVVVVVMVTAVVRVAVDLEFFLIVCLVVVFVVMEA